MIFYDDLSRHLSTCERRGKWMTGGSLIPIFTPAVKRGILAVHLKTQISKQTGGSVDLLPGRFFQIDCWLDLGKSRKAGYLSTGI